MDEVRDPIRDPEFSFLQPRSPKPKSQVQDSVEIPSEVNIFAVPLTEVALDSKSGRVGDANNAIPTQAL
jgi:hypothetical protein